MQSAHAALGSVSHVVHDHSPPELVDTAATQAGVGRLVLYHLIPVPVPSGTTPGQTCSPSRHRRADRRPRRPRDLSFAVRHPGGESRRWEAGRAGRGARSNGCSVNFLDRRCPTQPAAPAPPAEAGSGNAARRRCCGDHRRHCSDERPVRPRQPLTRNELRHRHAWVDKRKGCGPEPCGRTPTVATKPECNHSWAHLGQTYSEATATSNTNSLSDRVAFWVGIP
jgi:hypothetical protein